MIIIQPLLPLIILSITQKTQPKTNIRIMCHPIFVKSLLHDNSSIGRTNLEQTQNTPIPPCRPSNVTISYTIRTQFYLPKPSNSKNKPERPRATQLTYITKAKGQKRPSRINKHRE